MIKMVFTDGELGIKTFLYTECPNGHPYLVTEVRLFFYPKHECIVFYISVW